MIEYLVTASEPVTLVGAGAADLSDFRAAIDWAPRVVAADGGAALVLSAGIMPDAVIGDLDSLSETWRARLPDDRLHRVTEQDSTDFEKAMQRIAAPLVLAVGFTGARIDHELAVLHGLLVFRDTPCILIGAQDVLVLCPPRLSLDLAAGTTVSLFPLVAAQGRSVGLEWPIDGLDMAPGRQIGTSNRATGGTVTLEMDTPGMLLILPRPCLDLLIRALLDCGRAPARWPAP